MNKNELCFEPTDELVFELSSKLYPDPEHMFNELVVNGLDAATRREVEPVIEVRFWSAGEHPLSPDAPAVSVLDNGTGFTSEVLAAYSLVGKSVHFQAHRVHGVHGLGKFAAFGLSATGSFQIITRPRGETKVVCYSISFRDVFSRKKIKATPVKESLPGLPTKGSFACIFIAGFNEAITAEELRAGLTNLLPIRPCQVKVQTKLVALRKLEAEREVTTPPIPDFGGSAVTIKLAVAEVIGRNDGIRLIDAELGRPVVDSLDSLPPAIRRRLDYRLMHPRLLGDIFVPGNLEKYSEAGRAGIESSYWNSAQGKALIEALNIYGAPIAGELVGSEAKSQGAVNESLSNVAKIFEETFGEPDDSAEVEPNDTLPGNLPGVKPLHPSKSSSRDRTSTGESRPKKTPNPPLFGGVWIKVEDATYLVMSYRVGGPKPFHVTTDGNIVINTLHPEIIRLQKLSVTRQCDELIRYIIEAHACHKYGATQAFIFDHVYRIRDQMRRP